MTHDRRRERPLTGGKGIGYCPVGFLGDGMKRRIATSGLALSFCWISLAYGQEFTVGKSGIDQWTEIAKQKGRFARRQLAITSTDRKSELIVDFYPELNGLGMNVNFFDRPARPCQKATLSAIQNSFLRLDGKPLPGAHVDSFTAGCADEQWIVRTVFGTVDADVAIVQAFLNADESMVHLSSADGTFDHSYSVKGFRRLERGGLSLYQHSKGYRLVKSMEH